MFRTLLVQVAFVKDPFVGSMLVYNIKSFSSCSQNINGSQVGQGV